MGDGALDYNFPLQVDSMLVPDLCDASTGQKEAVDLAFTIVMRQYLNIMDYPLYFDEVGMHFDDVHKKSLMAYISDLKASRLCSHIFLVNHITSTISALSNYQVVVLDPRNIVVPSVYNNDVRLEHYE
jgi:energy-coupling factor transporter ATP-binding protein EcfA2